MYLYLVQHAEAKSKDEDPARGLTDKGWADAKKMADFADRLAKIKPTYIYHSGKTRAVQTADTFEDYLQPAEGMKAVECLGPTDNPRIMAELIKDMTDDCHAGGASAAPGQAGLAASVRRRIKQCHRFSNAGIVCLSRTEDIWSLAWIVTPEVLG